MPALLVRTAVALLLCLTIPAVAAEPADGPAPLVRISSENGPAHVQTRILQRFADTLRERAAGRLVVEFQHSASLYRDRDVVGALQQGRVEMALPGTWQLDRYEPTVGVLLLPMVYGRDSLDIDRVLDGSVGQRLNDRLEAAMGLHVLGRWIHLGFAHLYTIDQPVRTHADLEGLRIRSPGGEVNDLRLEALGARAVPVAWTDVPQALRNRQVDGLLSTHATVASAALWRHGVRYAFEDRSYFSQYVPLVSPYLWQRLPAELRTLVADVWEEQVDAARRDTAVAQEDARRALLANGVAIVTPPPAALEERRRWLRRMQDTWAAGLGMSLDVVRAFEGAFDGAPETASSGPAARPGGRTAP